MDLSKIKAVIADDEPFKRKYIRTALEYNGVRNIMTVKNQEELWEQIYHSEDKIDLIVTDMQYPLEAEQAVDIEAGLKLIERMEKEKIDIPVIVCSSSDYSISGILGSVWYDERNDLNADFKKVLGKLEKIVDRRKNMSNFEIWTDGGCAPQNPGIGGYGIIIVDNATQEEREIKQGFQCSTNNRMELRAVIRALNEIPKEASVKLHTDSEYVVKHVNEGQKKNTNHDLWKLFDEAMEGRKRDDVDINWVKGEKIVKNLKDELHKKNYCCDRMVHEARENKDALIVDEGYEKESLT